MADITESENKLLNELVKDCITYRLEEKEALQYIAIRHKQVSLSSYKHRKARVLSEDANQALELGEQFKDRPINPYAIHSIGVDIGFGSSNTAVVATEWLNEESKIRVIYSQEWEHGDPLSKPCNP